ncbi:YraN family protein [Thiolapillus sp.]|uniref:YraN family protein n=1 Tax=Thiolapillus sp. TaxID=2017437 RepID=UPI003AF9FC2A
MLDRLKPLHLRRGVQAENRAEKFLAGKGLTTIARNYRCKSGEIDLIMEDGATLVMVEVRYRKNAAFGSALESVTPRKQARIIAAASHYLVKHPIDRPVRFDVVAISGDNTLNWVQNAFQTTG